MSSLLEKKNSVDTEILIKSSNVLWLKIVTSCQAMETFTSSTAATTRTEATVVNVSAILEQLQHPPL